MAGGDDQRQAGHLFFEPKGYDHVNNATHEHKEEIKVGYNLQRKIVLLAIWALSPLPLYFDPSLFGLLEPHQTTADLIRNVGWIWLWLAGAGLLFRTVQLFFVRDVQTGLVWATKILTDPFHDIKLYHKAPLALLHGELNESTSRTSAAPDPTGIAEPGDPGPAMPDMSRFQKVLDLVRVRAEPGDGTAEGP